MILKTFQGECLIIMIVKTGFILLFLCLAEISLPLSWFTPACSFQDRENLLVFFFFFLSSFFLPQMHRHTFKATELGFSFLFTLKLLLFQWHLLLVFLCVYCLATSFSFLTYSESQDLTSLEEVCHFSMSLKISSIVFK